MIDDLFILYDIPVKLDDSIHNLRAEEHISSAFIKKYLNYSFTNLKEYYQINKDNNIIDSDYFLYYKSMAKDFYFVKYKLYWHNTDGLLCKHPSISYVGNCDACDETAAKEEALSRLAETLLNAPSIVSHLGAYLWVRSHINQYI